MYLKTDSGVREMPDTIPAAEGMLAWIDWDRTAAKVQGARFAAALGWPSALADLVQTGTERARRLHYPHGFALALYAGVGDDLVELDVVVGPTYLVTVHPAPLPLLHALQDELAAEPDLFDSPAALLYLVLERLLESYMERIDGYQDQFDTLEDAILNHDERPRDIFRLRRTLHELRRILADQRRVIAGVARRAQTQTGAEVSTVFLDSYDGFYQLLDAIDTLRDNLTGLVDLELNHRSMRLNEIMKWLTIFSVVFLPLSFITGFLGMNLHPMPELTLPLSQLWTVLLMAAVAGGMLWWFKRRHWL